MVRRVEILRGLPGSGKTHYAKAQEGAYVCSADHFHTGADGVYRFVQDKVSEAHDECMMRFLSALRRYAPLVIVDNTNTSAEEMWPYVRVAQASGYNVKIVEFECEVDVSVQRNVHGVFPEIIEKMDAKMKEEFEGRMAKAQHDIIRRVEAEAAGVPTDE